MNNICIVICWEFYSISDIQNAAISLIVWLQTVINYITSGPVVAMCLARNNGVQHWRQVLGPTKVSEARKKDPYSIRAMFGDPKNDSRNACHGSDSAASAEREIDIIFPHILKGSEAISERPLSGESAMMINGHGTIPIREPTTIFQA